MLADTRRADAGRDQSLGRPGAGLGIRQASTAQGEAAVAVLRAAQEPAARAHGAAARARGRHALERRAGAVGGPRCAPLEAPPAVAILGAVEPLCGPENGGTGGPGRSQRQDPERGQVDLALDRAAPGYPAAKLGGQVPATEAPRVNARPLERQDRPLQVAGRVQPAGFLPQVGDRRRAAAADGERAAPGGLEAEGGPAGHRGARRRAGSRAEAPIGVLRALEPADRRRRAGTGGQGHRNRERDQEHQRRRPRRTPAELEALAIARDHADQGRPGGEREHHVPGGVGDVERDPAGGDRQVPVEGLLAAIADHHGEVQEGAVRQAGDAACEREAVPPDPAPGHCAECGATETDETPSRHLPRRPRPLTEPQVGDRRRQSTDREPRRRTHGKTGDQDDVRGGDDIRDRGQDEPPRDGERRERGHQRDHARGRARALVPGKAAHEDRREKHVRVDLPGHGASVSTGPCAGVMRSRRSSAPRSGRIAPPAPRIRAVSVAKYQPPERTSAAGPSAITSPSPSSTTLSANEAANSTSWVAITTAAPPAAKPATHVASSSLRERSRPRVGSSRQTAPGTASSPPRPAITMASASRWRSPPERSRGSASAAHSIAAASSARRPASPGSSSPTRSRTSRSPGLCGHSAHPPGADSLPRAGSSLPAATRSSVVLPAPFRPISATRSPRRIDTSTPRSTSRGPVPSSSSTHTSRASSATGELLGPEPFASAPARWPGGSIPRSRRARRASLTPVGGEPRPASSNMRAPGVARAGSRARAHR